jgi:hypothetical protein
VHRISEEREALREQPAHDLDHGVAGSEGERRRERTAARVAGVVVDVIVRRGHKEVLPAGVKKAFTTASS